MIASAAAPPRPRPRTGRAAAIVAPRRLLAAIPQPRRLPVALGVAATIGVLATSLRALPPAVLFPLAAAWLAAFAVGAFAPRKGPLVLTVLAVLAKVVTVLLIVWVLTQPHSPLGPRTALDWVPLGMLNASTGPWWLAVIRHRAR